MTFSSAARRVEDALDDEADEVLGEVHEAVEAAEGDFGLDHPELGQVAAGLRFFRAEGGAEAVDLAEGERGGSRCKAGRSG